MPAATLDRWWRRITHGWRYSNCLSFAIALWLRRWRKGRRNNYLVIRLSRVPWGLFHILHGKLDPRTGQIKVVSYKPDRAGKTGVEIAFRGHVERGDAPHSEH